MDDSQSEEALVLTEIMLQIFRLRGKLIEKGDDLVRPLALTSSEWQILGAIALSTYPMTAPMVAEVMGLTRQGAQKRLNQMVQDGYFVQKSNPRHERSSLYELTDRGSEAFTSAMKRHACWANALVGDVDKADLLKTLDVLKGFGEALERTAISEIFVEK